MMGHNRGMHMVAFTLLVIGGLNWLLLGVFKWEIGDLFGGPAVVVSRMIYILVGLAALYEIFTHKSRCKECNPGVAAPQQ